MFWDCRFSILDRGEADRDKDRDRENVRREKTYRRSSRRLTQVSGKNGIPLKQNCYVPLSVHHPHSFDSEKLLPKFDNLPLCVLTASIGTSIALLGI